MSRAADWSLYLVTDRRLTGGRPLEEIVLAAARGGVTAVQLREKDAPARQFVELARRLKAVLTPLDVPLIINDRLDVALAAGADGVHIGQSDLAIADVRRIAGPDLLVGLTVESMDQAMEAEDLDPDYLGVSPIFATPTKTDTGAPWGIQGLAALRARSRHVLVAIGGLSHSNAGQVMRAGADGIAVVSAICSAPDPEAAARELKRSLSRKG
ncbi:MAG: thiamine phosphate synthase [Bryobacterales bacterium]|nr:thiamine phosphate synthase [Bryobacterales bacterium]